MKKARTFSAEVIREIEAELSHPLFRKVPLGPTLNDIGVMQLHFGHGNWSLKARCTSCLARLKHTLRPRLSRRSVPPLPEQRILVTWLSVNERVKDLVLPVLKELGPERCIVLCATPAMLSAVPAGFDAFCWDQIRRYDIPAWRTDYRRCWPEWRRRLRKLCRKHRLPGGVFGRMALQLLVASQAVAGCLQLLPVLRPSAILTEYDRNSMWSCLVLSARQLGIPTFSLVHGVLNERACGYVPVLADKVLCWGEMQRRQFTAEGVEPEKLQVAGCPRMTRELAATQADARAKLGLAIDKPVVMLGTTMVGAQQRCAIAELFCTAVESIPGISAVVRLHPSDCLETYASEARRHPGVRFCNNDDATLDDALAAADVVVVPNSGLGSDALVKRRLTIVLDLPTLRLGHAQDLIERASCPRATSAEELALAIRRLLFDEDERRKHLAFADKYVVELCSFFGQDSARRIAAIVRQTISDRNMIGALRGTS